jgi:ubiquinol-cytochrome c reductase iron-sulfur subunit
MTDEASLTRRHFLSVATTAAGVTGLAFVATPFVASFKPSTRARALGAPVEIDIGKLDQGSMVRVMWRGQPVWVLRRGPEMLERLSTPKTPLKDADSAESIQPDYAKNGTRSIKAEYLVVIGNCTHLGCAPIERFEVGVASELGSDWVGGFYCPCHGSRFDLAARVMAGSPAPTNLSVPPHRYASDSLIIIGEDSGASA